MSIDPRELRYEVEELYYEYVECLDDDELERWPEFFVEDCLYKIIPRENFERNLPIALMRCESKGMLKDRVTTMRETSVYAPRALRHLDRLIWSASVTPPSVPRHGFFRRISSYGAAK